MEKSLSILVCIKAVPDLSSKVPILPKDAWIAEEELEWQMNPYDAHALEAALSLKEAFFDVRVDVVSLGGEHAISVIRRGMAMGADHGVHIACEGNLPPEKTASAIYEYARNKNYDLILAGAISIDAMNGTTGVLIGFLLDIPWAAGAMEMDFLPEEKSLLLSCELEGGFSEKVKISCPCLVTMQTGKKTPRYPSLSNTLRARKQAIEEYFFPVDDEKGSAAVPVECFFPERTSSCVIIPGTPVEKADTLLAMFHGKGWLK